MGADGIATKTSTGGLPEGRKLLGYVSGTDVRAYTLANGNLWMRGPCGAGHEFTKESAAALGEWLSRWGKQ